MKGWIRLYITVEGQTEKEFADLTLTPHLANYSIGVNPRVVLTNRKLGRRGGILNFDTIRGDLERLMKQDPDPQARFTTMVDLYALPSEFPGRDEARRKTKPAEKVALLEREFGAALADQRFLPFIQLHEFETLLYCSLEELQSRIADSDSGIAALKREVGNLPPEEINEGEPTAPSKRIIRHVPIYARNKVRVGAPAAAAIGLNALRSKCPHFGGWLTRLEALGHNPNASS